MSEESEEAVRWLNRLSEDDPDMYMCAVDWTTQPACSEWNQNLLTKAYMAKLVGNYTEWSTPQSGVMPFLWIDGFLLSDGDVYTTDDKKFIEEMLNSDPSDWQAYAFPREIMRLKVKELGYLLILKNLSESGQHPAA